MSLSRAEVPQATGAGFEPPTKVSDFPDLPAASPLRIAPIGVRQSVATPVRL
jgi:hypothetical protein